MYVILQYISLKTDLSKWILFSYAELEISTSVTQLSIFIPIYILKVFTEGLVHISFIDG